MNILVFKSTTVLAGGENYVLEIMRAAKKAGGNTYLATDFLPLEKRAKQESFKTSYFFYGREAGNRKDGASFVLKFPWYHFKTFLFLLKAKMKWRIDTVMLNNINEKILITPSARLLGMRVIWIENLLWRPYLAKNPLFVFYRLFYPLISNLIVASEFAKKEIVELGFRAEKIRVLYFGIGKNLPARNAFSIADAGGQFVSRNLKNLTIGTVARLHQEKGLTYLISAFGQVRLAFGEFQKNPPLSPFSKGGSKKLHPSLVKRGGGRFPEGGFLKLLIVGDGPEKENLQKQVQKNDIKNVEFAGYQENLEKFYERMDIFVLPSLRDNFPLVILEAMGFGLPVVASNVGGVGEIIENGKNGILVKAGDTQELKNAIENLLRNEKLRLEIARRGFETVKKFSQERMREKILEILKP